MGTCPTCAESTETYELPPVFLRDYPDLESLRGTQIRQTALAIYYHNRMIATALDTLAQGRSIRGLSDAYVDNILGLIKVYLSRLSLSREAVVLLPFIANETVLLSASRRRLVSGGG